MQYKLVTQSDRSYLEDHINILLSEGWQLHGLTTVLYCGDEDGCSRYQYSQALVRPSQGKGDGQ